MGEISWGKYGKAYKALYDKIEELRAQVDKNFKTAKINHNTLGDNEIVAAVSEKKIKVYAIVINVAGTVSVKWRSGNTDLTGAMSFEAREGYTAIATQPPAFLLETNAGEALYLNLTAAVYAHGWIAYWDDDTE